MLVFPPGIVERNTGISNMLRKIIDHIKYDMSGENQHAELLNPPPVVEFHDDSAGTLRDPSVRNFQWTALIHDAESLFSATVTEYKEKYLSQYGLETPEDFHQIMQLFYAWHGIASPIAIVQEHYVTYDPQKDRRWKATYFLTLNEEDVDDEDVDVWPDIQDRLFAWVSGNLDRQSVYVVPTSANNVNDVSLTHPYKLCANAQGQKSSFFCERAQ